MDYDTSFSILMEWSGENVVSDDPGPEDLVYEISGKLKTINDNDDKGLIGRFQLYYVDIGTALEFKINAFDILDSHCSETFEFYEPLFGNDDPHFCDNLTKLFNGDVFGSNVLILNRIELLPSFRGKGIGKSVIRNIIRRFTGSAGIVALKAFPLQFVSSSISEKNNEWNDKMELDNFSKCQTTATEQLLHYYSEIGFRQIENSGLMALSTALII